MVQLPDLIDSAIQLIQHFQSCQQCNHEILSGVLKPSILELLKECEQGTSDNEEPCCDGIELIKSFSNLSLKSSSCYSNGSLSPKPLDQNGNIVSDQKDIQNIEVELISVSTSPDADDCNSSSVSSDMFPLPNIASRSSTSPEPLVTLGDINHVMNPVHYSETVEKEQSENSFSHNSGTVEQKKSEDSFPHTSETAPSLPASLNSEIACENVSVSSLPSVSILPSFVPSGSDRQSRSPSTPLVGRSALKNAILLKKKTPSTSMSSETNFISEEAKGEIGEKTEIHYRCQPSARNAEDLNNNKVKLT